MGNLGTTAQLFSLTLRRHYKVHWLVKIRIKKDFNMDAFGVHMILFKYIN